MSDYDYFTSGGTLNLKGGTNKKKSSKQKKNVQKNGVNVSAGVKKPKSPGSAAGYDQHTPGSSRIAPDDKAKVDAPVDSADKDVGRDVPGSGSEVDALMKEMDEVDAEMSLQAAGSKESDRAVSDGARNMRDDNDDRKTEAEKRFALAQRRKRIQRALQIAKMTHKQRVHEFNAKLDALSEHHDIPKVGPG